MTESTAYLQGLLLRRVAILRGVARARELSLLTMSSAHRFESGLNLLGGCMFACDDRHPGARVPLLRLWRC